MKIKHTETVGSWRISIEAEFDTNIIGDVEFAKLFIEGRNDKKDIAEAEKGKDEVE